MAGADMAHADMANADMANGQMSNLDLGAAPRDLGSAPRDLGDPHAGMRCVERASLFHCSFAPSGGGASGPLVVMLFAVAMLARVRRARRHG
jgi:MYXO-CTERM domain-containing protein